MIDTLRTKVSDYIDNTMPRTPEEAARRLRTVKRGLAIVAASAVGAIGFNLLPQDNGNDDVMKFSNDIKLCNAQLTIEDGGEMRLRQDPSTGGAGEPGPAYTVLSGPADIPLRNGAWFLTSEYKGDKNGSWVGIDTTELAQDASVLEGNKVIKNDADGIVWTATDKNSSVGFITPGNCVPRS